jgi:hypothetical protein
MLLPCWEVDISQRLLVLVVLLMYGLGGQLKFEFKRELNVLVGSFFWWSDAARLREPIVLLHYLSALFHKGEKIRFLFYRKIFLQYMTDRTWAVVVAVALMCHLTHIFILSFQVRRSCSSCLLKVFFHHLPVATLKSSSWDMFLMRLPFPFLLFLFFLSLLFPFQLTLDLACLALSGVGCYDLLESSRE